MNKIVKVLHGGTLGDAFSAHCRADRLHELYNIDFEITRASRPENVYFDKSISEFYSLFPWIKYNGSRTDIVDKYENRELRPSLEKLGYDIVMLTPKSFINKFPKYDGPNCFPKINVPKFKCDNNSIVVQVQGGKVNRPHGESRGFSIETVSNICKYFSGTTVYLIGVNNKFLYGDFNFDEIGGAVNLIGKTSLIEAMSLIKQCNLFIGFDGFFTFFAPSQQIPTVHCSHLRYNGRISYRPEDDGCGKWFDYSLMIRPIICGAPFDLSMDTLYFCIDNIVSRLGGEVLVHG